VSGIRVGAGLGRTGDVARNAARLEALGFDTLHTGEHLFFHVPTQSAPIALAVAAGATERIRLVSAVVLLPLYPAAQLAKMASVLDVASGGRLTLGVGVGGEYPPEFRAAGVPVSERGRRSDEALEVMTRLFTGEPVTYAGRWADVDGLALRPPPAQPGGPPIWVAGRKEAAQRRAGRHGAAWMPYLCTPEQVRDGMVTVRAAATEAGRDPDAVEAAAYLWMATDPDGDRARRLARETLGRVYAQDFSRLGHYIVAGTPAECAARIREYAEAGARHVQLNLACGSDEEPAMLERIAADILPALRG
jgi:probable F420-dependent oxidoreductase